MEPYFLKLAAIRKSHVGHAVTAMVLIRLAEHRDTSNFQIVNRNNVYKYNMLYRPCFNLRNNHELGKNSKIKWQFVPDFSEQRKRLEVSKDV
jgi:hypothetical protein